MPSPSSPEFERGRRNRSGSESGSSSREGSPKGKRQKRSFSPNSDDGDENIVLPTDETPAPQAAQAQPILRSAFGFSNAWQGSSLLKPATGSFGGFGSTPAFGSTTSIAAPSPAAGSTPTPGGEYSSTTAQSPAPTFSAQSPPPPPSISTYEPEAHFVPTGVRKIKKSYLPGQTVQVAPDFKQQKKKPSTSARAAGKRKSNQQMEVGQNVFSVDPTRPSVEPIQHQPQSQPQQPHGQLDPHAYGTTSTAAASQYADASTATPGPEQQPSGSVSTGTGPYNSMYRLQVEPAPTTFTWASDRARSRTSAGSSRSSSGHSHPPSSQSQQGSYSHSPSPVPEIAPTSDYTVQPEMDPPPQVQTHSRGSSFGTSSFPMEPTPPPPTSTPATTYPRSGGQNSSSTVASQPVRQHTPQSSYNPPYAQYSATPRKPANSSTNTKSSYTHTAQVTPSNQRSRLPFVYAQHLQLTTPTQTPRNSGTPSGGGAYYRTDYREPPPNYYMLNGVPPPQPTIKKEGHDASSPIDLTGNGDGYFASEKKPLKAMSLYMSDLRGEEPEDILVELKVASMVLVDEDDRDMGYQVEAKEVGQALQRGRSRLEGPARVYVMKGRFKRIVVRVSADNKVSFDEGTLTLDSDKGLEVFVDKGEPASTPAKVFGSTKAPSSNSRAYYKQEWDRPIHAPRSPSPKRSRMKLESDSSIDHCLDDYPHDLHRPGHYRSSTHHQIHHNAASRDSPRSHYRSHAGSTSSLPKRKKQKSQHFLQPPTSSTNRTSGSAANRTSGSAVLSDAEAPSPLASADTPLPQGQRYPSSSSSSAGYPSSAGQEHMHRSIDGGAAQVSSEEALRRALASNPDLLRDLLAKHSSGGCVGTGLDMGMGMERMGTGLTTDSDDGEYDLDEDVDGYAAG